jgi:GntR family transcriptional regulator, transcriptional repressor for pyruvate dehydrogenase complex
VCYTVTNSITVPRETNSIVLRPIVRETLSDRLTRILKRYIREEKLRAGDQLPPERDLAAILGVSQGVLRETLLVLAHEGIIVKQHGRGNFVGEFDPERLQTLPPNLSVDLPTPTEIDRARCAIEIGAAHLAVLAATDDDIAALRKRIEAMSQRVAERRSIAPDDLRFHLDFLKATHSDTLMQFRWLIEESMRMSLYEYPVQISHASIDESRLVAEHMAIIDALARRDGLETSQAVYRHLKDTLARDR